MSDVSFWTIFKHRWRQYLSINGLLYGWDSLTDYYRRTWSLQLQIEESA